MIEWIIKVDPQGNVKSSVKGVKGTGCKKLTEDYDRVAGSVTSDKPTAEMKEDEARAYNKSRA